MQEILTKAATSLSDAMAGIEDKLRERGKLVSLTGDNEADVTLVFVLSGDDGICLRVDVTASDDATADEDVAEDISDYTTTKIYEAIEELDAELSDEIQDVLFGVEVYMNGEQVY